MHESLDPQIELPDTRRHFMAQSTTRRTSRILFEPETKQEPGKLDNTNTPLKENNILSDEKIPILRLQSSQYITPKGSIMDSGKGSPRKSRSNSRSNSKSTELLRPINNMRMSRYFRQARPNASVFSPSTQRLNATPLVIELNILLANMSTQERLEKAARHLNDALYLRTVRHDIDITDSKFLKWVYYIQTNLNSQTFLYLLTWVFLGLTYLEPPNSKDSTFFDENPSYYHILLGIETPIVFLFLLEMGMELYHVAHDPRSLKQKYVENKKIVFKFILNMLFLIDYLFFYISDVHITLRFSRPVRPFCLAMYSKQLRRTIDGIIKSVRQMIDVILFFVILTIIYAAIGIRIIGDLDGEVEYDEYSENFKDFGPAMNIMYILLSKDNYPDAMLPAINSSPYYYFYFIPFVAINTLLFVPIPIAVIFDAFRAYRAELVVSERIKEREALVACFISLDIDGSGTISKEEFMSLCTTTYGNNLDEEKVDEIFHFLDEKRQGKVTLDSFFSVAELMEDTKNLSKSTFIKFPPWDYFRRIVNKVFKFDVITAHIVYEAIMSLVVLFNTVILIVYAVVNDDNTLNTLDSIDNILVYIYVSEIIIKIFGMGLYKYFTDRWNLLDFTLTIVSLVTEAAVSFGKIARTAKAGRLLRLSRAQRALKILKVLRSVKLFRCLRFGFKSLSRMKRFVQNIMLCLPIVLKLTVVMFMISYCYAIIGMEIFYSAQQKNFGDSPYNNNDYADFDSFGGALLILFQVVVQAQWGDILFDWAWRFNDLTKASLYFNTFYSLTNLIIISLLTGLIWEVFTYMEKQFEQQDKIDEQLEAIYLDKFTKDKKHTSAAALAYKRNSHARFSRDISMSELSFANMNETKRDIRQVKSMNTIDMSSPSPFPEALPSENRFLKPSNSLLPPSQNETLMPSNPFNNNNNNMQTSNPRMRTLLPSRFKSNSIAPSRSESDAALLVFKPSGTKDDYDIEKALEQIESKIDINDDNMLKVQDSRFINHRPPGVNTRNLDSPSLSPDPGSPDLIEALNMSSDSQRKDRYKSVDIGDTVPDFRLKEGSVQDTSPRNSRILLTRDAKSVYSIKPVPLDDNYPLTSIRDLRNAISKNLHYLNKGDVHPVKAETEKSLEGSMCAEEEAKSMNTQTQGDMNKVRKNIQNKRLRELNRDIMKEESFDFGNMSHNTSFAGKRSKAKYSIGYKDNKSTYKYGRSDSMNTSMKSVKVPKGPIVNETFISDARTNDSGGEAADAKTLEKEFYMRKITVCKYMSTEKNQLGYISKKSEKKKFKLEYKLLRLGSSESEDSEEEKDTYTKSEHDLTVSEAKMRYLETLKKKMQNQIGQTGDRILRKALLQNQNENVIQKYEDEHFREIYGQWFEYLKNPKIERIRNVFEIENKILIRFMRLMKQDEIVSKDFVEITNMIEESINKNLLRQGSLGKFLFRDIQGKWFFVFKDNHKFKVHYLSAGFWNYFEDIFTDKTKLYEGQDILFPGLNDKYAEPVDQLYTSLKKLAHRLARSKFTDFAKNEHLWNMYMIPFQVSSKKHLKREVFKAAKERPKIDIANLQNTLITDGVFCSVNYIMKTRNLQNMEKDSRIDTSQIIQMEKSKKQTMQKGYENLQRLARPQKVERRRTSLSVQASGSGPSSDVHGVQKRMPIHELFKNETNDVHGHQGKTMNKTEEFLPLQEYIDFMKDVRDALNLHKDHLLIKFSTFYAELCSKNKAKHEKHE